MVECLRSPVIWNQNLAKIRPPNSRALYFILWRIRGTVETWLSINLLWERKPELLSWFCWYYHRGCYFQYQVQISRMSLAPDSMCLNWMDFSLRWFKMKKAIMATPIKAPPVLVTTLSSFSWPFHQILRRKKIFSISVKVIPSSFTLCHFRKIEIRPRCPLPHSFSSGWIPRDDDRDSRFMSRFLNCSRSERWPPLKSHSVLD